MTKKQESGKEDNLSIKEIIIMGLIFAALISSFMNGLFQLVEYSFSYYTLFWLIEVIIFYITFEVLYIKYVIESNDPFFHFLVENIIVFMFALFASTVMIGLIDFIRNIKQVSQIVFAWAINIPTFTVTLFNSFFWRDYNIFWGSLIIVGVFIIILIKYLIYREWVKNKMEKGEK